MDYPRYDPASPVTPLAGAELDALDQLLAALPADGAMSLDGVDGYLTALQVGPPGLLTVLPSADWLPGVWGGDGADAAVPFASKRQRKATVVQLLRHLRHLGHQFDTAPDAWEPIFSIAEKGEDEWVDARDWCAGFLQAVDLQPGAWALAWADPALAEVVAPLLALGGGVAGVPVPRPPADDDLAAIDQASRAVPEAALALRSYFRPEV